MAKGTSIAPSSFSEDAGLLDMSMEDVVGLFLDREKKRAKDAMADENQQEGQIGSRVIPMGLMLAVDSACERLGTTKSLLTKCLSHHVAAWFDSLERIRKLAELFKIARSAAYEFGYPDLYDNMRPNYTFTNTSPRPISFKTICWVRNKLYGIAQPVGVPVGSLFIIGLCFSLSTSEDTESRTVRKYLEAEVAQFKQHVEEQYIQISGFHDKVRLRARKEGFGEI